MSPTAPTSITARFSPYLQGVLFLTCCAVSWPQAATAEGGSGAKAAPAAEAGKDAEKKDAASAEGEAAPEGAPEPLGAGEDYLCEVEIYYTWTPTPKPGPTGATIVGKPKKSIDAEPKEEPLADTRREFAGIVGENGVVEAEVKNRVVTRIPQAQLDAVDKCKLEHEDRTGCVTAKLRRGFENYNRLDYAGRQALLEALSHDCDSKLGSCGPSEVSEVVCSVNRSPDAAPPEKKTEEEGKADGGKADAAKGAKKK